MVVQSNAFMPEKPLRFAGGFTAEAVTLNEAKYLITYAHLLMKLVRFIFYALIWSD